MLNSLMRSLPVVAALASIPFLATAQPVASASGAGMNPTTAGGLGAADRKFIDNAAIGGMAEVAAGKMAQEKGRSDAVKTFAGQMVQDHGKANDELVQLASTKGVTPPAALDKRHQMMADHLSKLSGAAFDREYMKGMVADHKATVALFQKEASSGSSEEVKAWAAKMLPTLQGHLKMAMADEASMNPTKTSSK